MDLDSVADDLYRASPETFVERRTELVAAARRDKNRELVKAITALRRPTRSAWLVNLLAREAPQQLTELLDLGRAMAEAQRQGSGADLRRLSAQRHRSLEALTRQAVELAAAEGHSATEATRQEVVQTLSAALADSSVADLVRGGRVVQPASYGGFGPLSLVDAMQASVPADAAADSAAAVPAEKEERAVKDDADEAQDEAARVEAETAARAAAAALDEARQRVLDVERSADQATAHADELADRVETLRGQLQEAEAEERSSRAEARTARKSSGQAQHELVEAERAAAEAMAKVATLR